MTRSPDETRELGARIGRHLQVGDVVGLVGELGAGKTVLAQGIARGAGVEGYVASPTFALVNVYRGRLPLIHADWYRVQSAEELFQVGFEDLYEGHAVVIEWMDRVPEAAPAERLEVRLAGSGEERRIELAAFGERHEDLLGRVARVYLSTKKV